MKGNNLLDNEFIYNAWEEKYGIFYFLSIGLKGEELYSRLHSRSKDFLVCSIAHDLFFDENLRMINNIVSSIVLIKKTKEDFLKEKESFVKNLNNKEYYNESIFFILDVIRLKEIQRMILIEDQKFSILSPYSFFDKEGDKMFFYISCQKGKMKLRATTEDGLKRLEKTVVLIQESI